MLLKLDNIFVTKDIGDFRPFQSVACREYTLPRDDRASQPKGWIQGNMRIGPVLEVTTSFQHFKYGIEIRIKSVNQDDSHSWVSISYGTVKYVIDSIEDNTEIPADPQEEQISQTSTSVVAARSKAKAKPQPRELAGTIATIPIHQRRWIDIEPSKQDLDSYDLSKKVINLLRHNQTLQREEDGAIQFYKIKFHLRDYHLPIQNWSDDRWLACLAAGGGSKRRHQYCSDYLGSIIYLRALQGHSGSNLIDLRRIIGQRCVCLHHTWHEQWVRLSCHNKSPRSIMAGVTFFTHIFDCSANTELINRNNCAKNSFNRSRVSAIVC